MIFELSNLAFRFRSGRPVLALYVPGTLLRGFVSGLRCSCLLCLLGDVIYSRVGAAG